MIKHNRVAWTVVVLLFCGSVINYMDRALLGIVMPQIRESLSISNKEYGLVVSCFLVMYMIFYVAGGRIADRIGYRRAFLANVVFWSVAAMLHSLARGLASLCVFRALLGIGEGGFYPTAMRGVASWFGPENRAKAVAVVLAGVAVGMLLAAPVMAWLTFHYGWRAGFLVTGALGLLLVPPWLLFHRKIQRLDAQGELSSAGRTAGETGLAVEEGIPLREALRRRQYWFLLAARAITDAVWFFYLFWLPAYFQDIRGFDLPAVGKWLWIPYVGADIGGLAGAWISSGLVKRGFGLDRSRKAVMVASAALCLFGAASYYVSSASVAVAFLSIAFFGQFSWGTNLHTVITETAPRKHLAVLYGITGAAGTMVGAIAQRVMGHLVDSVGYEPAFLAAGVTFVLAIVLLLTAGKIESAQPMPR